MTARTLGTRTFAILCGVAAGALVAFSADALGPRAPEAPIPAPVITPEPSASPSPRDRTAPPTILLAWSPRGLPNGFARALRRAPGVVATTMVKAQLDWLQESLSADGAVVDRPRSGRAIPFEVAGVEPGEYARFVLPSERAAVAALGRGDILLARTETALRGGAESLRFASEAEDRTVVGVLSDETAGGYEGLVRLADLPDREEAEEFTLVLMDSAERRAALERRIARLLADRVYRTRIQGETPFLRYGDAVLPQMVIKQMFGEFAAEPQPDGSIEIDPNWSDSNLIAGRVPLIGQVVCHRAIIPQLRIALQQVKDEGLGFTIDPGQFAGCFGPRFVNRNPRGRISHHAWGIALDLNAATNAFGSRPHQDRRLVRIMEDHGFTWGGRWLIPDGMHFEAVRLN